MLVKKGSPSMSNTPESLNPRAESSPQEYVENGVRFVSLMHKGEHWRLGSTTPNWRAPLATLVTNPDEATLRALNTQGVWLARAQEKNRTPKVAVTCCGQGSVWLGMGRALYDTFPAARSAMDRIAAVAPWDILSLMDATDTEMLFDTRWQQPYIFLVEYAQATHLESLGFAPDIMSGHSLGELVALCLAKVYTPEKAFEIIDRHAVVIDDYRREAAHNTGMLVVYNFHEDIATVLESFPELTVSNYNSPTQYMLSGPKDVLMEGRRFLRKKKVPAITLNVDMAFHHPNLRAIHDISLTGLLEIPTKAPYIPLLSNVTGDVYPHEHEAICRYIADLDSSAVRWVECVNHMWNTLAVRHFVELGPADTISGLNQEIQPQAVCVPTGAKEKEVEAMRAAVAQLYSLGHIGVRTMHAVPAALSNPSHPTAPYANMPSGTQEGMLEGEPGASSQSLKVHADAHIPPHVQDILPILAEATGFDVKDLRPHMDLRHDLAVRSSRFPAIMLNIEHAFHIQLQFEDFVDVSTIGDLAQVISRLRHATAITHQEVPKQETQAHTQAVQKEKHSPLVQQHAQYRMAQPVPFIIPARHTEYTDMAQGHVHIPALIVGKTPHATAWEDIFSRLGGKENVRHVHDVRMAFVLLQQGFHPSALVITGCDTPEQRTQENDEQRAQQEAQILLFTQQALELVHAFVHSPRARLCVTHEALPAPLYLPLDKETAHSQSPFFATLNAFLSHISTVQTELHTVALTHHAQVMNDALRTCMHRIIHEAMPFHVHVGRSHMHGVHLEPYPWNAGFIRKTSLPQGIVKPEDHIFIYAQDRITLAAVLHAFAPFACTFFVLCAHDVHCDATTQTLVKASGSQLHMEHSALNTEHDVDTALDTLFAHKESTTKNAPRVDCAFLLQPMTLDTRTQQTPSQIPLQQYSNIRRMLSHMTALRAVVSVSPTASAKHKEDGDAWVLPVRGALVNSLKKHVASIAWHAIHVPSHDFCTAASLPLFSSLLRHQCLCGIEGHGYWYMTENIAEQRQKGRRKAHDEVRFDGMPLVLGTFHQQKSHVYENPILFPAIFPQELSFVPDPYFRATSHFSSQADSLVRIKETVDAPALLERLCQGASMAFPWLSVCTFQNILFDESGVDILCSQGMVREAALCVQAQQWSAARKDGELHAVSPRPLHDANQQATEHFSQPMHCDVSLDIRSITDNGRRTDTWRQVVHGQALMCLGAKDPCDTALLVPEGVANTTTQHEHLQKYDLLPEQVLAEHIHLRYTPLWAVFQLFLNKIISTPVDVPMKVRRIKNISFLPPYALKEKNYLRHTITFLWSAKQRSPASYVDGHICAHDGTLLMTLQGLELQ